MAIVGLRCTLLDWIPIDDTGDMERMIESQWVMHLIMIGVVGMLGWIGGAS